MDLGHALGALGSLAGIAKGVTDAFLKAIPWFGKDHTLTVPVLGTTIPHVRQKLLAVLVSAGLLTVFKFDVTGALGLRTAFPWVGPAATLILLSLAAVGANDLLNIVEKGGS